MKQLLIFVFILLFSSSANSLFAQEFSIEMDTFMFKKGYFDDLETAKKTPNEVLYLNLSMQHPKLKELPDVVLTFVNLERLDLSYNQLAGIRSGISALSKLNYLNVAGNHYLTTIDEDIKNLTLLKEFNIKDNRIPKDELEAIKRLLPNCTFIEN